jgi:putative tricarboxylic transport membrane protein
MTDRIAGLVLIALAIWYGLGASRLEAGFGSGPVGPKAFPLILAIALGVIALFLLIRPDPEPRWPKRRTWGDFALLIGSFIAYAYLLAPAGFLLATTVETGFVSQRFGAKPWQALLTGLIASGALYLLFVFALGIPLPLGRWFVGR